MEDILTAAVFSELKPIPGQLTLAWRREMQQFPDVVHGCWQYAPTGRAAMIAAGDEEKVGEIMQLALHKDELDAAALEIEANLREFAGNVAAAFGEIARLMDEALHKPAWPIEACITARRLAEEAQSVLTPLS